MAIVFGGAPVYATPRLRERLACREGDTRPFVVAADRGATRALELGYLPDLVLGDMDSIEPETLARLTEQGIGVESHPRDKDATDGHLAVDRALQEGCSELLLLGFLRGPRLDHEVANLLLLLRLPRDARGTLLEDANDITLLRGGSAIEWRPEPGEIVSLVAPGLEAVGVTTRGLRWQLSGETLHAGDTRGVSNEPQVSDSPEPVGVALRSGALFVLRHFPS